MTDLVFVQNNKVVTDSLTVAETFSKEHARVLRDIRELKCSEDFRVGNFAESTYKNSLGREYPQFIITEQGFSLLVMGYTGNQAMEFKEMYINEFHKMRENIKNNVHVLDDREAKIQSMKLTIETAEKQEAMSVQLKQHDTKLSLLESKVENEITLSYGEQRRVQKAVASRVYELYENPAERPKAFSGIYREIKDRFAVASYKDVRRVDLLDAINYIENWIPKKEAM